MIKKTAKNEWTLFSKDGSRVIGTFDSFEKAQKREQAIKFFKVKEK